MFIVGTPRSRTRARPEASRRQRRRTALIPPQAASARHGKDDEAERIAAGELLGVAQAMAAR